MKLKTWNLKLKTLLYLVFSLQFLVTTTFAQSPVPIGEHFGFGNIKSLGEGTTKLVGPAFAVTAAIVVIFFLLGAFRWLRAGGNKEEVEAARQMIQHSVIGFVLLMAAFVVLQFLLSSLFGLTGFQIIQTQ